MSAAEECFGTEVYISMTDGGEPPLVSCHECGKETFLLGEGTCIACGAALDYTECGVCGASLGTEEQDFNGLCSYHNWLAMKDD